MGMLRPMARKLKPVEMISDYRSDGGSTGGVTSRIKSSS